ncbi:MAG: acetyl-CoA C-acetyltransferase [Pseudomonadota bacterium]|nr:acetyl-CoA C-acetyltransferase [Pseudomonadota bacterium]
MQHGREVFIVDGSRTPFLRAAGRPGAFTASDLAVAAGRPLLARQVFAPEELDEVILGCVSPGPDEANIGRIAALRLGCGKRVPAWTVARNCASGMQALDSAAANIALGRSELVLAGGAEAMSHAPILFSTEFAAWLGRWSASKSMADKVRTLGRLRPVQLKPVIGLLRGLRDPVAGISMGQTAEELARRFAIERETMDAFALRSHQRLAAAIDEGRFQGEVESVFAGGGKHYESDDGLRRETTMEKLARLKPVFDRPTGSVTAGNSAQITDGCAWLILASEKAVKLHELPVLGRLVDSQWAGLDPRQMGLGPVYASTPILQRHGFRLDDIDYWEINEAFAAQVLACLEAWRQLEFCREELGLEDALGELDQERLNIDGGGISIGHPVGASGARIVLHAFNVLRRKDWRRAVATLCIGGGQGGAVLLERP